jgi:hypothetical protein
VARYFVVRPGTAAFPESLRKRLVYLENLAMLMGRIVDSVLWLVFWIAAKFSKPPAPFTVVPETIEIVGGSAGYLHRAELPPPPRDFATRACFFGLHHLLTEDSAVTRWLRREPVRLSKLGGPGTWEIEDPLDFKRKVRLISTAGNPPWDFVQRLNRRLLSLMLTVRLFVYLVEIAVWHAVGVTGRPLLDRGPSFAIAYGLGLGVVFGLLTVFGNSSLGAAMQGLVGGLSLDPTLGLTNGFGYWIAHRSPAYAVTFLMTILTTALDRRVLGTLGMLTLLAGIYLQALPFVMPK